MKNLNILLVVLLSLPIGCAFAQKKNTNKPAAQTQQQNSSQGGQQQNTQDTTANDGGKANDQVGKPEVSAEDQGGADASVTNVPVVPQHNTTSSGSPAVVADESGKKADGTNNVQRATMNMAGAKVGNMNLDEKASNENTELRESERQRQGQHLPGNPALKREENKGKNVNSRAGRTESATPSNGQPSQQPINNNSLRENKKASEQNLESKSRAQKEDEKGEKAASKRKKKRNKNN